MDGKIFDTLARDVARHRAVPRRTLLGALTSFLVLAVDALHALQVGEEAAAKGGRFGGSLGGRHGKNKRGRDKNRNNGGKKRHKRKKGKGNPPGLGGPSWIYVRMVVENLTSADIEFEGQALYEEMSGKICRTKALQTIHPNEAITFAPGDNDGYPTSFITALLNGQYGVDAAQEQGPNHDFPVVWAYSGLKASNIEGCTIGTNYVISNRKMGVGQQLSFTLEGQKFELRRENDIDNARLFRLRVLT